MMKKQFVVIGLGRFGSSVAKTLSKMDYEVLAIDRDEERVQEHAGIVTHVVQADATDENALKSLGIRNFDVVVIAIGEDIQSSIMATLIVKEMGVPTVVVKARNELHGKVLQKIGANKVIFPERDMGIRVAHNLISPNILDFIEFAEDYSIVDISVSPAMVGKSLAELNIRARYGCNIIAIKNGKNINIAPRAEDRLREGDIMVVIGHNDDLQELEENT
ncbi:MAG: potassium uptake system protein [Bacillus thermozeamaize]|uniref:Potassium uptake system protein n=1 Tax=Bacillus thermozeamaize TaxID=230954 RepID=A0A1Y3PTY7_9BACI|nr:MAG: potassium uptake system protein [Bacillus thermozeamaize]